MKDMAIDIQQASRDPLDTQEFYNSLHFSQATVVGDKVWLSGERGSVLVGEDAQIALQKLLHALDAAREAVAGLVELTTQEVDQNHLSSFAKQNSALRVQELPRWTAVGVLGATLPGVQIEVKAVGKHGNPDGVR